MQNQHALPGSPNPNDYFLSSETLFCVLTDAEGKVQFVNHQAAALLNISPKDYIRKLLCLTEEKTSSIITTAHSLNGHRKIINWEVFHTGFNPELYKWIAPASFDFEPRYSVAAEGNHTKEEGFKNVADKAPVMIWMSDMCNNIMYVNKTWEDFTGVTVADLSLVGWRNIIHPEDVESAVRVFEESFQQRLPITITYRLQQKNGSFCWVQDRGTPRFSETGVFLGYIGTAVDINDQKKREKQLRTQVTILENVSDIIILVDLEHRIISANKVAEQFYDLEGREYTGKLMPEVIELNYGAVTRDAVVQLVNTHHRWEGEVSFTDRQGRKKYLLNTVTLVLDEGGNKIGMMGVGRNITERKQVEAQLQKSEQFYRSLIADSLDGILIADTCGKITFVSSSITHTLGYEPDDIVAQNLFQFVHPDDHTCAIEAFQNEINGEAILKHITIRLLKKNGEWLWCMVRGNSLLGNAAVGGVVIYFHDDTLRKEATDALKESEQRFKMLVRNINLGVALIDSTGKITMANKALATALQVQEEDLINKSIHNFNRNSLCENGRPFQTSQLPISKALRTKKPVHNIVVGLTKPLQKEPYWFLINAEPILDENKNIIHIICSINDITERKKMEQKLLSEQIHQQKLLTQATIDGQEKERKEIGKELHDNVGQQLTTTKLFLDLAKATADDNTNEMISMASKGISDVINEVRRMSRSLVPPTLGDLGLIESINEVLDSISRTQFLKIDFHYFDFNEDFVSDSKKLMLFRITQEQLNNIVKHAEAKRVIINLSDEDEGITLEIRDDGTGFNPATIRKGLGLTNIKNRAELFGGTVKITSAPAKGCSLQVFIPHVFDEISTTV